MTVSPVGGITADNIKINIKSSGLFFVEFYDNGELVDTKSVSLTEGGYAEVTGEWDLSIGDTVTIHGQVWFEEGDVILYDEINVIFNGSNISNI